MSKDTIPSKPLALALLAGAQFLIVLDGSIVNVALPSIRDDLNFSPEGLSWILNAYALMFGGLLLLGGRLADLVGRRRIFIAGLSLFGIASLLAGFASTELQLIFLRGAQGLGAALVSPAALSMISVIFKEGKERNKAFGIWGAMAGSGAAVGVLLGGILTDALGWEWIFFINVPVTLTAVLLSPRLLAESRMPGKKSHDVPGAITVTAGLMTIVYAIVDANNAGWGSSQTIGLLAAGFALLAVFVVIEMRTAEPLIQFSIFKLPTLRAANIVALIHGTSVLAAFFVFTVYMQDVLGFSAIQTGLGMFPLCVAVIVFAGIASRRSTSIGFKRVLVIGAGVQASGLVWLAQMHPDGSYLVDVLGPSLVIGAGFGAVVVALTIAGLTGTDQTNAGLSSGLLNTSQQVGRAIGLAVLISVYTSQATNETRTGTDATVALTDGLASGTLVLAGLCFASMVIAALTMSSHDCTQPTPVTA